MIALIPVNCWNIMNMREMTSWGRYWLLNRFLMGWGARLLMRAASAMSSSSSSTSVVPLIRANVCNEIGHEIGDKIGHDHSPIIQSALSKQLRHCSSVGMSSMSQTNKGSASLACSWISITDDMLRGKRHAPSQQGHRCNTDQVARDICKISVQRHIMHADENARIVRQDSDA